MLCKDYVVASLEFVDNIYDDQQCFAICPIMNHAFCLGAICGDSDDDALFFVHKFCESIKCPHDKHPVELSVKARTSLDYLTPKFRGRQEKSRP